MSLINQMLQDLEARRANTAERAALPSDVRPLPVERRTPWTRIALGAVVAGLLAWGAILWQRAREAALPSPAIVAAPAAAPPVQSVPAPAAQVAQPASMPAAPEVSPSSRPASATPAPIPVAQATAAAPVPEVAKPAPPAPEPKAKPTQPAAGEQARPGREARLKVATSLSVPRDAPGAERAPSAASRGAAAPAALTSARPEEGPPSIEKQVHTSTARERAENEYRKAIGFLNQGRLNETVAGLRSALKEDPGHANARLTLFGILIEQQKLDEAQILVQEGLNLNPAQPQLAMRLARIQVERGELRGAAETLQKASGAAAANAEYRGFQAAVLQRLGRHKEAADEYQAALRLFPKAGVWWMGLGISLEAEGRLAEAREAFQRAKATGVLSAELDRFVDQKLRANAAN